MRQHFVRLGKQTLVYGLGAVAQQILGIITLPIYARVFDPSAYGVVEIITVGLGVLAIMVDLGLTSAAQRSYFDYADDDVEQRRTVLSTWMVPSLTIASVIGVIVAVASQPLAVWLFGSERYATAVLLAGLSIPASTLATLVREVMRLRFQPWYYLGSALITGGIGAILSVVFVLALNMGVSGVVAGALAGNVLAAVYGLVISRPHIGRRVSRHELRVMVAFGLPLIPSAMAMWMLQFVDRILLSKLGNLNEVGQYAVANRLSQALLLVVSAFGVAYSPFMLSLHAEDAETERRVRGHLLTYVTAALVVAAVVLSVFAREIIAVIAPSFDQSYQAVALVCTGTACLGFCQVAMAGITLTRRTQLFAMYSTIAAVVNLGLNFVLIPAWGQVGAAAATAAGYLLLAVLYYRGAQRVSPTPYEPVKLVSVSMLGAALMPIGLIGPNVLWLDIVAKVGAMALMAAGLWVLGIIRPRDLSELRGYVTRRRVPSVTT